MAMVARETLSILEHFFSKGISEKHWIGERLTRQ